MITFPWANSCRVASLEPDPSRLVPPSLDNKHTINIVFQLSLPCFNLSSVPKKRYDYQYHAGYQIKLKLISRLTIYRDQVLRSGYPQYMSYDLIKYKILLQILYWLENGKWGELHLLDGGLSKSVLLFTNKWFLKFSLDYKKNVNLILKEDWIRKFFLRDLQVIIRSFLNKF